MRVAVYSASPTFSEEIHYACTDYEVHDGALILTDAQVNQYGFNPHDKATLIIPLHTFREAKVYDK